MTHENPSAFPDPHSYGSAIEPCKGMSLRDYFAAAALTGLLGSELYMKEIDLAAEVFRDETGNPATREIKKQAQAKVVSELTFYLADAMLAARGE